MSSNSESVIGSSSVNKLRLKRYKFSRPKMLLAVIILSVIVIVGMVEILSSSSHPVRVSDTNKLLSLVKKQNCSSVDLKSVSSLTPSLTAPNASLILLTYRAECAIKSNQYSQAVTILSQEKAFALKTHNSVDASNAANQLAAIKDTIEQSNRSGASR